MSHQLLAVLLDLGDVIMREETEQKVDGVTQRADLVPGMADLLRALRAGGARLGLVADTRVGTYRNVLRQHHLFELFEAFAISDELGCEKPDRRIFVHALDALGIAASAWGRVAMVGNNLERDIRGANDLGLLSIWLAWNERYLVTPASSRDHPRYQVSDATELGALLLALDRGEETARFRFPRPFPWRASPPTGAVAAPAARAGAAATGESR